MGAHKFRYAAEDIRALQEQRGKQGTADLLSAMGFPLGDKDPANGQHACPSCGHRRFELKDSGRSNCFNCWEKGGGWVELYRWLKGGGVAGAIDTVGELAGAIERHTERKPRPVAVPNVRKYFLPPAGEIDGETRRFLSEERLISPDLCARHGCGPRKHNLKPYAFVAPLVRPSGEAVGAQSWAMPHEDNPGEKRMAAEQSGADGRDGLFFGELLERYPYATVFLVEGFPNAACFNSHGAALGKADIIAVGLPGCGSLTEKRAAYLKGRKLIVGLDFDANGAGLKLAQSVVEHLADHAPDLLFWRSDRLTEDFNDWYRRDGSEEGFSALLDACEPGARSDEMWAAPAELPPPVDVATIQLPEGIEARAPIQPMRLGCSMGPLDRYSESELALRVFLDWQTSAGGIGQGAGLVYDERKLHLYREDRGIFWHLEDGAARQEIGRRDGLEFGAPDDQGRRKSIAMRQGLMGPVLKTIKDRATETGFFAGAVPGLAFSDGFVRLGHGGKLELVEHSPEHRARHAYDFPFCPGAKPKRFLQAIGDMLIGDMDSQEKIECLREFVGVCLLGQATKLQKALVLHGPGGTGRSVICSLVEAAFPAGSTVSVSPQQMGGKIGDMNRTPLVSKLLNVKADVSADEITDTGEIKSQITGDTSNARYGGGTPFDYHPTAGHLFGLNTLPHTQDLTDGFFRRWIVLDFARQFTEAEKDPALLSKLMPELPLFVSWCLEGGAGALARGRYTVPASAAALEREWRKTADPVKGWLIDCTEKPHDGPISRRWASATECLESFNAWAEEHSFGEVTATKLGERLKDLRVEKKPTNKGNRYCLRLK